MYIFRTSFSSAELSVSSALSSTIEILSSVSLNLLVRLTSKVLLYTLNFFIFSFFLTWCFSLVIVFLC